MNDLISANPPAAACLKKKLKREPKKLFSTNINCERALSSIHQ